MCFQEKIIIKKQLFSYDRSCWNALISEDPSIFEFHNIYQIFYATP
jgi:hypothetical protein